MKNFIQKSFIALVFIFLYAPIVVLIVFSFNDSMSRAVWTGFTFKWYAELFNDSLILSSLYTTLLVASLSAAIATFVGTAAAVGIYSMKKIPRSIFLTVNNVPVMNPDIITGVSLMLLFVALRFETGFTTLLLAHITFNAPYVILSVMPKLRQLDPYIYEAALDLGAAPLYAFSKVVIPEIISGVITGFMISFTLSIDDFVVERKLDKVDFIKLDIEGSEGDAIHGAAETIRKFKPRLAISLYHKNDDFLAIPKSIKTLRPDYRFFLGHYTVTGWETVLYAV